MSFLRTAERGFTSVEILVVLALIGVLTLTGTQQFLSTMGSFSRMTAINKFQSDIQRARAESIAQGGRGILLQSVPQGGYRMGIDYWPFGETVAIERQLFASELGSEVEFTASGPIIFNSRGFLVDETGVPTMVTMSFTFRGGEFCTGELFSSGVLEMDCR